MWTGMAMPVQFVVGFAVVQMQMAMVVRRQLRAKRPDLVGMLVGVSTEYGRVYVVSVHAHIRLLPLTCGSRLGWQPSSA